MISRENSLLPFIKLFRRHWKGMGLGTVLGLATICAGIGLLGLAGWFIAAAAYAGLTTVSAQLFNLFLPSVGVRVLAMMRTIARYAERIVSHETTFGLLQSLRVWFYRKLEPLAPARLMQFRSGDILNRIVADIDALDNLYLRVVSPTTVAVIVSILTSAFLWIFNPGIAALIGLSVFGGGFLVSAAALKAGSAIGAQMSRRTRDLRVATIDGLQGMAELLVFGAHMDHLAGIDSNDQKLIRAQHRMIHLKASANGLITLLAGTSMIGTLVIGIQLVHQGELDGANLALVVFVALAVAEAVLPLPAAYQFLGHTREAAGRLQEVVATEPEVVFRPVSDEAPRHFGIEFEGLVFGYGNGRRAVLEGVDLEIEDHERVAILGQTGAGKSTLANLLVRFWDPQAGCVRIGGVDVRKLSESDLRRYVAVVAQRAHMFNASLRDNLLLGNPKAGSAQLEAALRAAGLRDWVETLPRGLETWIGESGRRLSSGQSRRLALARAIVKDAPIWVLDEPTEGLDHVTEQAVMATLLNRTRNRTLLLITHRLAGLEKMDRIVVIEGGRILEQGSHAKLINAPSRYAQLAKKL